MKILSVNRADKTDFEKSLITLKEKRILRSDATESTDSDIQNIQGLLRLVINNAHYPCIPLLTTNDVNAWSLG